MLHVADGDVGEQVEAPSQQEGLANLGDLIEPGNKVVDGIPLVAGEFDVDEGFHAEAELSEIDLSVGSAE